MNLGPLHHLLVGPPRHGVTRYAELLLGAVSAPTDVVTRVERAIGRADIARLLAELPAPPTRVHVHVTDHLFGRSPEEATEVVGALGRSRPLSITLHDLPQHSDGAPFERRRAAYAAFVAAAEVVVVSSEHEDGLLSDLLAVAPGPTAGAVRRVVPLAVPERAGSDRVVVTEGSREVAVCGFVYPGKGHAEVLTCLDGLPPDVGMSILGGASPGHDWLVEQLQEQAGEAGRRLTVTGWLADDDLARLVRSVAVPVFAPRHVSASASLTTWIAAGRRPVVTRNPYTEEIDRRQPGAVCLVQDDLLGDAIQRALADPDSTWSSDDVASGLSPLQAATLTFAVAAEVAG